MTASYPTSLVDAPVRNIGLGVTGQVVSAVGAYLPGFMVTNTGASVRYVKIYDKATAATEADTPVLTVAVPAGRTVNIKDVSVPFSNGISMRATTGVADNDTGAPGANDVVISINVRAGTDVPDMSPPEPEPPAPAYDYLITDDASWATVFANSDATLAGKTIAVASGNYTAKTITGRNPASTVRIVAQTQISKPVIDELTFDANPGKFKFEYIKFVSSSWNSTATNNNAAFRFTNTSAAPDFEYCDFQGNYRGVVGAPGYDTTTDDVPELASILPVFNGSGVVTSLVIENDYVGDLMANGTYSLIFQNSSNITFTVAPVATMTVSAGRITSTTLTSGGSSNGTTSTGIGIRSLLVTWTGQRYMGGWIPRGISSGSPASITGTMNLTNCTFDFFSNSYKPSGLACAINFDSCTFTRSYMDFNSVGSGVQPVTLTYRDCFISQPFSKAGDPGDPHADGIQTFMTKSGGSQTLTNWPGPVLERNIIIDGGSRGGVQGFFLTDEAPNVYYEAPRIVGNLICSSSLRNGLVCGLCRDGYVYRNTVIRYNPLDAINVSAVDLGTGTGNVNNKVFMGDNITESLGKGTYPTNVDSDSQPNIILGKNGATIAYGTVFTNHTGPRTTIAEIMAAYTPKAGYEGKGCFGDLAYINHLTKTTDRSLEPTFIKFNAISNQTASTLVTSEWSRVQGGTAGRPISISGGEYRIADDVSGTNAGSWTSSAGTVDENKFVQLRCTTSGSGSTTSTIVLTIGSTSFNWQVTTASATSFSAIDNAAAAWSNVPSGFGGSDTIKKVLFVIRCKVDAYTSGNRRFTGPANSSFYATTGGVMRFQFGGASNRCLLNAAYDMRVGMRTYLISLDFTNNYETTDASIHPGVKAYTLEDGRLALTNTFDTRTTAGSGTDYGSATITQANLTWSTSGFGVFATHAGTDIVDGTIESIWMDYGLSGYSLLDLDDPVVRNKFTRDNIGSTGQGPTGSAPKLFWTGTASEWNTGLANLGTLTATLTKQAGTYT